MPLFDPRKFREIVSGRRLTLGAAFFRPLAALAEWPVGWAVAWRNWRYNTGRASITKVAAPVVSVGNLTLGGTGKTPLVARVASELLRAGRGVTLLSRGYGSAGASENDEAKELALRLPDVPHLQNPDRIASARQALAQRPGDVLVLDDAFQHRRIARDLDIVLLDALEPFGFDRLFPRGTLREPPASLARAHAVILSRADLISAEERTQLRERVRQLAPQALWAEVRFQPQQLRNAAGELRTLATLEGGPVVAFCGIGNPTGFEQTLSRAGLRVLGLMAFQDHQAYAHEELKRLAAWVERHPSAMAVLCTLKDLVKLEVVEINGRPLWGAGSGRAVSDGRKRAAESAAPAPLSPPRGEGRG